jgi:hypothetical protein
MNSQERRKYWIQYARQHRQIENQYVPRVQKVLNRQVSSLIREAEIFGWERAIMNMPLIQFEMMEVLNSLYKKTGNTFYPQIERDLRQKGLVDDFVAFLIRQGLNLVANMDKVTKDEIVRILMDGREKGLSFKDIAKVVKNTVASGSRVLTIVRTEIGKAANLAIFEAAKKSKYVVVKEWVSRKDNRVRRYSKNAEFDHWLMDGIRIGLDEEFSQLGSKGIIATAMHPGDPKAPAGFVINCRCVLAVETVKDSNGRLIRKQ